MAWGVLSVENCREEFVRLALSEGANISSLCDRYEISRSTGYKWIGRSCDGFKDRSRRPSGSPNRTPDAIESLIVKAREVHPTWGGRKLRRLLENEGATRLPSPSTITEILRRHDLLRAQDRQTRDWQRFERDAPNQLWQMDFKGHFAVGPLLRCHPLTILDDHSRFSLAIQACTDERRITVQSGLIKTFRQYGLPDLILCDNGSPWGGTGSDALTGLEVWLIELGIGTRHGRAYHPQTQGKLERFHRTLKADVLQGQIYADLAHCQKAFDKFRHNYNQIRPHEAHALAVPATRYSMSLRSFPTQIPDPEYDQADVIRRVQQGGELNFQGKEYKVSKALVGKDVALRTTHEDGIYEVRFYREIVAQLNLRYNLK